MATPHNPKHILQLLKVCSWKSESPLNFSGFLTLENAISAHQIKAAKGSDQPDINQSYLNRLNNDTIKALSSGETVGRNADYISAITNFIGYNSWKSFEEKIAVINAFIDTTQINLTEFNALKTLVYNSTSHQKEIEQLLGYTEKNLSIPLFIEQAESNIAEPILKGLLENLKEYPFVIWLIDNNLNETLKSEEHSKTIKTLLEKGQVIPIRVGKTIAEQNLRTSFMDKNHDMSGQVGILMALANIENMATDLWDPKEKQKTIPGSKTTIETFNHNGTGSVFVGPNNQKITGKNVALGGITQNFYNKED